MVQIVQITESWLALSDVNRRVFEVNPIGCERQRLRDPAPGIEQYGAEGVNLAHLRLIGRPVRHRGGRRYSSALGATTTGAILWSRIGTLDGFPHSV